MACPALKELSFIDGFGRSHNFEKLPSITNSKLNPLDFPETTGTFSTRIAW
jgi:hypothetical protein